MYTVKILITHVDSEGKVHIDVLNDCRAVLNSHGSLRHVLNKEDEGGAIQVNTQISQKLYDELKYELEELC